MSRVSEPLCPVRVPEPSSAAAPAPRGRSSGTAALPGPAPAGDAPLPEPAAAEDAEGPAPRTTGDRPVVLLSGSSGIVGEAVAYALRRDFHVVALRGRRAGAYVHEDLPVDLAHPRLGLDSRAWDALVARADVVVHAAGRARYDGHSDEFQCVNVSGSRRMAELASAAGAPLIHLSSAFVDRVGQARDAAAAIPDTCPVTPLTYLESKVAAERAVAASDALTCVVRPSLVMGDSDTGRTPELGFVHEHIKMLLSGVATSMCGPHQRVDMVPRDIVARAVAALVSLAVHDPRRLPSRYWATSGPAALTCAEFGDIVTDVGRRGGLRLAAPDFHDPAKAALADYPDWDVLEPRLRSVLAAQAAGSTILGAGEILPTSFGSREVPGAPAPVTVRQAQQHLEVNARALLDAAPGA